jgi:hypothetical protein
LKKLFVTQIRRRIFTLRDIEAVGKNISRRISQNTRSHPYPPKSIHYLNIKNRANKTNSLNPFEPFKPVVLSGKIANRSSSDAAYVT